MYKVPNPYTPTSTSYVLVPDSILDQLADVPYPRGGWNSIVFQAAEVGGNYPVSLKIEYSMDAVHWYSIQFTPGELSGEITGDPDEVYIKPGKIDRFYFTVQQNDEFLANRFFRVTAKSPEGANPERNGRLALTIYAR